MSDDLFAPESVTADQLVGEGKKFKTADDLAKSKVHADQHISNLEKELSELRGELQARLTVEQLMEKIQKPAEKPNDQRNVEQPKPQEPGSPNLTEEVSKILAAERRKEKAESNLNSVRNELKTRFGADYNQKLASIADELNVSKEFLTDMAKTSPTGFLKLIDSVAPADKERPITPPQSERNSAGVIPNSGVKNAAYYRELRRTKPDVYFSKKVQAEMHNEAVRQGASFYN